MAMIRKSLCQDVSRGFHNLVIGTTGGIPPRPHPSGLARERVGLSRLFSLTNVPPPNTR